MEQLLHIALEFHVDIYENNAMNINKLRIQSIDLDDPYENSILIEFTFYIVTFH